MRTFLTVFFKEIIDNVRDRRTLASALIMGPIFGPVMFAFIINMSIDRALDDAESTMELPVIGREHCAEPDAISGKPQYRDCRRAR